MTDLLFRGALGPQPGGDVQLLFGATDGPPPDPPLPDPRPGLLRASVGTPWVAAARAGLVAPRMPWRLAEGVRGRAALPWASGARLGGATGLLWAASVGVGGAARLPWANTAGRAGLTSTTWRGATLLRDAVRAPWQAGVHTSAPTAIAWADGRRSVSGVRAPWAGGRAISLVLDAGAGQGLASVGGMRAPWQAGRPVGSIGGPWTPPPLTPEPLAPCYQPDPGSDVLLLFRESLTGLAALIFACRRASLTLVPIRRVYMVTNVTSLVRVSDGASIPTLGFSLSLDVDSWAWGFSASIQPDALPLLEPDVDGTPVELAAWVNGTEFRVFPESIGTERTFSQHSMRVQGRGITAVLDAPISPISVFSATAALTSQQLLDQALPFGWTADFGLTPWLVPGGIWSHQGTPISAAVAIAQAGGGYVQPHASAQSISVLPLYPVKPWDWAGVTPDIELPAAFATREGIEWVELPRYNRVYVSGTTAGVRGRITRTGTAGDILAPGVVDPLITTAGAAEQRGVPILAKTGRLAYVTLRLPVAEGTGVIRPGKFVRYTDGAAARLGLVRSVAVDVVDHTVWQVIRLETFA